MVVVVVVVGRTEANYVAQASLRLVKIHHLPQLLLLSTEVVAGVHYHLANCCIATFCIAGLERELQR